MKTQLEIEVYGMGMPELVALAKSPPMGVTVHITVDAVNSIPTEKLAHGAITVVLSIAKGVPVKVIAAWICEKFKPKRHDSIVINRRKTKLTQGDITIYIEEEIIRINAEQRDDKNTG